MVPAGEPGILYVRSRSIAPIKFMGVFIRSIQYAWSTHNERVAPGSSRSVQQMAGQASPQVCGCQVDRQQDESRTQKGEQRRSCDGTRVDGSAAQATS